MKKGNLIARVFGIALAFTLVGAMLPFGASGSLCHVEASPAIIHIGDDRDTIRTAENELGSSALPYSVDANEEHCPLAQLSKTYDTEAVSPWPMYGHDSSHTCRSSANGPTNAEVKWTYSLGVGLQGDNASPVIGSDGTVYLPNGSLFAINPDGTLKWKKGGWTVGSMAPAVANDSAAVYVYARGILTYRLYALNPVTGDIIWFYDIGYATYGSPTIGFDGTIYLGGMPDPVSGPTYMYAINPDGTLKWCWEDLAGGCWIEASPAIGPNGELYFQHGCLGLVALDINGQLNWTRNGVVGGGYNTPSVGPDGTIYLGDNAHCFHALNPDGTIKWEVPVDNWMDLAAGAISSDGSAIYCGDDGGIFYAFDSSGYVKWKYDTGIDGTIECAPALTANGIIYFVQGWTTAVRPNDKGYIYALRASDGALVWKHEIGWSTASPAIAADGTLYAVGRDAAGNGVLYAFRSIPNQAPIEPGNPTPADDAVDVPTDVNLSWTSGDPDVGDTVTYDVYFDTVDATTLVAWDQSPTTYSPPEILNCSATYYWRVVAEDNHGETTSGPLWDFTTGGARDVDISIALQGGSRPPEAWELPITIKFFSPGADVMHHTPIYEFHLTTTKTDGTAICQCAAVMPGVYDVTAQASNNCPGCNEKNCTLTNVRRSVVIFTPSTAVYMGTLLAGDANCDGIINISDFGILAVHYMCLEGEPCHDCGADFDCNGIIDISDFGLLAVNYMKMSPIDISG